MTRIKLMFYWIVLEFISDWYSVYKVPKGSDRIQFMFGQLKKLKGKIRDMLESEGSNASS